MLVNNAPTPIRKAFSPMTMSGLILCHCARMWVSTQKANIKANSRSKQRFLTDRSTRPSDSSIENESFVLTYSQRFSKMPEEGGAIVPPAEKSSKLAGAASLPEAGDQGTLDKLAKVLKNKNNLILDFKENEK